jgi:hypothetical protein
VSCGGLVENVDVARRPEIVPYDGPEEGERFDVMLLADTRQAARVYVWLGGGDPYLGRGLRLRQHRNDTTVPTDFDGTVGSQAAEDAEKASPQNTSVELKGWHSHNVHPPALAGKPSCTSTRF